MTSQVVQPPSSASSSAWQRRVGVTATETDSLTASDMDHIEGQLELARSWGRLLALSV